MHFILPPKFLYDKDGLPNYYYFEKDGVHLNRRGYISFFDILNSNDESTDLPLTRVRSIHDEYEYAIGEPEHLGKDEDVDASSPVSTTSPPCPSHSLKIHVVHFPP